MVNKDGPVPAHRPELGQCWVWTGKSRTSVGGYGLIGKGGRTGQMVAHRASWELHVGPIPDGMSVLHHCDNPPCVRPEHLFLGTRSDNMRDMQEKHRHPTRQQAQRVSGENSVNAKLTWGVVRQIRAFAGAVSQAEIARHFGISVGHVSRIVSGKAWKLPPS
jgi:hypothetical protein